MQNSIAESFHIGCPAAAYPATGMVTFYWILQGGGEGLQIEVVCVADGVAVAAPIRLSASRPEKDRWFAIHSHLLPNACVDVRARLIRGDEILVERELTLNVRNEGELAERVRVSLLKSGTPLVIEKPCDSAYYDYADVDVTPWFDRPDALDAIQAWLSSGEISAEEADHLRDFVAKGYVILPDLIAPELVARINAEIDDVIERKYQNYEYGSSVRIEKLHEHYQAIRELWLHDGVMRLLRLIFRSEPRPCQTLTYVFGSEQDAHQDTIHLTPFPAGYMCGVWVAMEDVRADSGELEVYVGSHRLPRVRMREAGVAKVDGDWTAFGETAVATWRRWIEEGAFDKLVYRPKKGTVLIWHENLMHSGSVRRDKTLSRRSVVSHVFADGAIAYYDSTGQAGHIEPIERMKLDVSAG